MNTNFSDMKSVHVRAVEIVRYWHRHRNGPHPSDPKSLADTAPVLHRRIVAASKEYTPDGWDRFVWQENRDNVRFHAWMLASEITCHDGGRFAPETKTWLAETFSKLDDLNDLSYLDDAPVRRDPNRDGNVLPLFEETMERLLNA